MWGKNTATQENQIPSLSRMKQLLYPLRHDPLARNAIAGVQETPMRATTHRQQPHATVSHELAHQPRARI